MQGLNSVLGNLLERALLECTEHDFPVCLCVKDQYGKYVEQFIQYYGLIETDAGEVKFILSAENGKELVEYLEDRRTLVLKASSKKPYCLVCKDNGNVLEVMFDSKEHAVNYLVGLMRIELLEEGWCKSWELREGKKEDFIEFR